MYSKSLSALALLAALVASTAQAEERFPAGGITLDPKADVTIAKQDVYLSVRQVRVHYDYASDVAQTVTLRFENPIVPIDGGPDHLGGAMLDETANLANYAQVTITANGETVTPTIREYAYLNGVDITEELTTLGLSPYVSPYVEDSTQLANAIDLLEPAKVAELAERGVIILDENGEPSMVGWSYKSVLEWEQPLAAGTTAVDIAYVPLNGYPSGVNEAYYGEGEDKGYVAQMRDFYCLDDGFYRAVNRKRETVPYFETVELGFAMSLEDRARPVEEFTLTVDKAETAPDMGGDFTFVAFCPIEAKKISDTQFQWTATDFTPSRDIDVVYFSFEDRFAN